MRTKKRRKQQVVKAGTLLPAVKAALFGCVLTIVAVLLFALLLKWEVLTEAAIPVVTSVIKALCAAFAGYFAASACNTARGWIWAGASGALYVLLSFLAFALLEKAMAFTFGLLADILMGFVAGVAGGMTVQLKKRTE